MAREKSCKSQNPPTTKKAQDTNDDSPDWVRIMIITLRRQEDHLNAELIKCKFPTPAEMELEYNNPAANRERLRKWERNPGALLSTRKTLDHYLEVAKSMGIDGDKVACRCGYRFEAERSKDNCDCWKLVPATKPEWAARCTAGP